MISTKSCQLHRTLLLKVLLGNFAHVHTEWSEVEGSGWSPAYTVTTLLVQLQSVIINIDADLSEGERKTLFQLCST